MPRGTARGDPFPDLAAGDGFAAQSHLGIELDLEAHLAAEVGEHMDVAGCLVAEAEVKTLVHFARLQLFRENALDKLSWSQQGEIPSEGKQQDGVDPGGLKQAQFFGSGREQFQSRLWAQKFAWDAARTSLRLPWLRLPAPAKRSRAVRTHGRGAHRRSCPR